MPVSGVTPNPTPPAPTSPAPAVDSSMFLQLLTTQLQHQNPLDPMDPTEFTGQLATYSALEQQIQMNDTMNVVTAQLASLGTFAAISYLGATAQIEGPVAPFQDGAAQWSYTLPEGVANATITITNAAGDIVYSGPAETDSGAHVFTLLEDETQTGVANGEPLTMSVAARAASGAALDPIITAFASITSLDALGADAAYEAGGLRFTADDIIRLYSNAR